MEVEEILKSLRSDFKLYARKCLKIRTKGGELVALELNAAQQIVHEKLEWQLSTQGKIRALILKARQEGISTYIEGRYYWKVSGEFGKRAIILTHEQKATDKLFAMAQRFHDHCPEDLKPHTKLQNAKELFFDTLDSGYEVATAGTKAVGRGGTGQYLHGSEMAFWQNAEEHMSGIGQVIPDLTAQGIPTEIIFETTANGPGGLFHQMWQRAESGTGDYIAIFIPWYVQEEYRKVLKETLLLTDEEEVYKRTYKLDNEQMAWRRAKIIDDFNGDMTRFQQEYPATSTEAFIAVGIESYIKAPAVVAARICTVEASGPLIVGVDPNRFGDDAMAIIRRKGRKAYGLERWWGKDTMQQAGLLARIINEEHPAKMFIDIGGVGAGVYDRLNEMGYGDIVHSINFGSKPIDEKRYINKRAEMWGLKKGWLEDIPVQIPDDDSLHADLVGPQYSYDSNGRLKLESKEDMRKRGIKSPDSADALCLTFAFPVQAEAGQAKSRRFISRTFSGVRHAWMG